MTAVWVIGWIVIGIAAFVVGFVLGVLIGAAARISSGHVDRVDRDAEVYVEGWRAAKDAK